MEAPSDLQQFLNAQREEGAQHDEGEFTVAREKALSKLAEFQLPFDGAWALKMVQCAIAAGVTDAIRIDQTYSETRFYFAVPEDWSLADFEDAFYEPEPSKPRALDHFKRALWTIALNQKRPFQISLPRSSEMLVWNGEKLTRAACPSNYHCLYVAVCHRAAHQQGFVGKLDFWTSAERNAEVMKALADYAFVCPVPLTVDNRRLDALQFCPVHGLTESSHPLSIRYLQADLPKLKLSPGTFRKAENKEQYYKEARYQKLSTPVVTARDVVESASVIYLISYHAQRVRADQESWRWVERSTSSTCHWVQDGVCVDQDKFAVSPGTVAMGAFLNAQGIATDLTSLKLQKTEEREQRLVDAAKAIREDLIDHDTPSFRKASLTGNAGGWLGGVLLLASGVATLPFSLPMCLAVSAGGVAALRAAQKEAKQFEEHMKNAFEVERLAWKQYSPQTVQSMVESLPHFQSGPGQT